MATAKYWAHLGDLARQAARAVRAAREFPIAGKLAARGICRNMHKPYFMENSLMKNKIQ
jgi:hypothetical protein